MSKQELSTIAQPVVPILSKGLIDDLRVMIDRTKESIAVTVNSKLAMLYWHVGHRVRKEILNNQRAEYGQEIVSTVSRQLSWSHFTLLIPIKDSIKRNFSSKVLDKRKPLKLSIRFC